MQKEKELAELQAKLDSGEQDKKIAVFSVEANMKEKLAEQEKKITELETKAKSIEKEKEFEVKQTLADKAKKLLDLTAKMNALQTDNKLKITEANSEKEKEIAELKLKLLLQEKEAELEKNSIKEKFDSEIKQKDETIAFYKDFKAKQSTKMVGESLEQYCEIEFNRLRIAAFQNAEFGKDNDAKTDSKGDYIYRELDENGTETISICSRWKTKATRLQPKRKTNTFLKN